MASVDRDTLNGVGRTTDVHAGGQSQTVPFDGQFTFGADAQSTADQIAVQLGLPGAIGAAAYPGIGGRDASTDGHHLSLSTRVISAPVPEPGTFTLLALGLIGLGRIRWRR